MIERGPRPVGWARLLALLALLGAILIAAGYALWLREGQADFWFLRRPSLRDVAAPHGISVGVAVSYGQLRRGEGNDPFASLVLREFNSITPGNELKWEWTHPCPPLELQRASGGGDLLYNEQVEAWVIENSETPRRRDPANQFCNLHDPADEWYWQEMDEIVRWARDHGVGVYAVPLIWHMQNPEWLDFLTPYQARWLMERHIREAISRYCQPEFTHANGRSVVYAYDVVNEAITSQGLLFGDAARGESNPWHRAGEAEVAGDNYVRHAYLLARSALVDHCEGRGVRLFYNDHDFEYGGAWTDGVYELLAALQQPRGEEPAHLFPLVDGVGMQAHLRFYQARVPAAESESAPRYRYSPPPGVEASARLIATMNRFSRGLGLEVKITELDVSLRRWREDCAPDAARPEAANGDCAIEDPDPRAFFDEQARIYAHVAAACVLADRCTGFTTWGLHDESSWLLPMQPLMFELCATTAERGSIRFCPKPAYDAVYEVFANTSREAAGNLE